MASDPPPKLRKPGSAGETGTSGAEPLSSGMGVNAMAELVVDLLSATGLVPDDKLAMVRGRAGQGSLAQAIVDEGVAPPEGIARSLAVRYQVQGFPTIVVLNGEGQKVGELGYMEGGPAAFIAQLERLRKG